MKPDFFIGNSRSMEELILYFSYGRLKEVSMSILHASVRKKSRRKKAITKKDPNMQICQMIVGQRVFNTSQRFGRHGLKRPWWNQLLKHWNMLNSTGHLHHGLYWSAPQAAKPERDHWKGAFLL